MKTIIEIAINWWNKLYFEQQFFYVIEWLKSKNQDTTSRHPDNLTGNEIEQIYFKFKSRK